MCPPSEHCQAYDHSSVIQVACIKYKYGVIVFGNLWNKIHLKEEKLFLFHMISVYSRQHCTVVYISTMCQYVCNVFVCG